MWLFAVIAGAVVVLTGWLPAGQAHEIGITRALPVLGFLAAITVLAELAGEAGVFDAAATLCARVARGRTAYLFVLVAVLGTLITVGMSLDTTAVLLTPVVLTVTVRLGLRPLPFAMLVIWLANTASLLLPVSNLTNLLALHRAGVQTSVFLRRMALPEVVAVALTVCYLALVFRRDLGGRFEIPTRRRDGDRVIFGVCTLACVALAPGILLGGTPWVVATPCAAAAVAVFAVRRPAQFLPERLPDLVPWRLLLLTEGLFLVVTALTRHGLGHVLGTLTGGSDLRATATAALSSNALNNLPSYLAMETTRPAAHATGLLAVLIGTNAGPLITGWGSLATLLWRERCRAHDVVISARSFTLIGLVGVPVVLGGSWLALMATG